eukprot:CAMPEP_0179877240 /NCGR_PEP_ID=MMETSP0982-20121206/24692_1 /TAXON_ID=483367 /ORGANISM="non described non described, Strain CCMP 2436" /LENGTH=147 /DNA_ID=CAMNT_0021769841 /DNA_START=256 /DNA_END=697 /DNA_ORIENTATION=-
MHNVQHSRTGLMAGSRRPTVQEDAAARKLMSKPGSGCRVGPIMSRQSSTRRDCASSQVLEGPDERVATGSEGAVTESAPANRCPAAAAARQFAGPQTCAPAAAVAAAATCSASIELLHLVELEPVLRLELDARWRSAQHAQRAMAAA